MKHFKEIRVAILAMTALALFYFGFNYLKGINIFHKSNSYVATFHTMNGLVEQGPVYVKGYKVGIVEKIEYDFSREEAFVVHFSTNTDIDLPEGTIVALVPDGLLGGEALALRIPTGAFEKAYERGDTIPSEVELGMIEGLSSAVMTRLDPMLGNLDSIIAVLKNNLTDEQLKKLMDNANGTLANARGITAKFDNMMACEVPYMLVFLNSQTHTPHGFDSYGYDGCASDYFGYPRSGFEGYYPQARYYGKWRKPIHANRQLYRGYDRYAPQRS